MDYQHLHITLVLMIPFLGGIIAYFSPRSALFANMFMVIGGALAVWLLFAEGEQLLRWQWLPFMELGWKLDRISALLICLVYLISLLVHLFSVHYLKGDPGISRYYFKLGFFTSSMLGLLLADHLLLVFVFWELVGFSSYLLIGFWFREPQRAKASKEAFMVNRVADAGLLVGVIIMISILDLPFLSSLTEQDNSYLGHLAGFGLLIGALGKSAQVPFFGWLPKAMAGPTPVSALIHAATMVAAGVYLLVRTVEFLPETVLSTAAVIGGLTAFMAAFAALKQFDIKKVLAYSTVSQLGYMVMGIGVGAYQASLFHLWTHAFFKAGLFLAAGSIIAYYHTLHHDDHSFDAQDMSNMGGLRKILPVTFYTFLICALALSGLPFFSGFLSKEGILAGALVWAHEYSQSGNIIAYVVPNLAFIAALFTPIYIGRQVLLVFYGSERTSSPKLIGSEPLLFSRIPLVVLTAGSLWFFNSLNPLNAHGWWFNNYLFSLEVIEESASYASIQTITMVLSIFLAVLGLLLSYVWYRPSGRVAAGFLQSEISQKWYWKLSYHGWYTDLVYEVMSKLFGWITSLFNAVDRKIIDPLVDGFGVVMVVFSKLIAIIDREIIDGLVNLAGWISRKVGLLFSRVQSPRIQVQLTWMVMALVLIIIWFLT